MDDVDANKYADNGACAGGVRQRARQNTVVPMGQTFSVFSTAPTSSSRGRAKTLEQLVRPARSCSDGKVKFGFVAGMSMNHTWFQWLWSMWGTNCDVSAVLRAATTRRDKSPQDGGESGRPSLHAADRRYWWDAINTTMIVRGMPAYDRNEANAIFMAGDAAFTVADTLGGHLQRSRQIQVSPARSPRPRFPLVRTAQNLRLGRYLGLAIPKSIAPRAQKLAKQMLEA